MGSSISSVIAEAVMQRLEETALQRIHPKLWVRYVDDTFVIIKQSDIDQVTSVLNSIFDGIQFTMEIEADSKLPFLDILVTRVSNGALETCVYRKKTNTDKVLDYTSNHPSGHKQSCVRSLFHRIESHCNTHKSKVEEKKNAPTRFLNSTVTQETT